MGDATEFDDVLVGLPGFRVLAVTEGRQRAARRHRDDSPSGRVPSLWGDREDKGPAAGCDQRLAGFQPTRATRLVQAPLLVSRSGLPAAQLDRTLRRAPRSSSTPPTPCCRPGERRIGRSLTSGPGFGSEVVSSHGGGRSTTPRGSDPSDKRVSPSAETDVATRAAPSGFSTLHDRQSSEAPLTSRFGDRRILRMVRIGHSGAAR